MNEVIALLRDLLALKINDAMTLALPLSPENFEKVSQHYGNRDRRYKSGIHAGTDFAVPVGTPLYAIFDGTITSMQKNHPDMGNVFYFTFQFKDVWYTARYMHLSALPQRLQYAKGEQIALSGTTGKVTGPHLHLDIQRDAQKFRPARLLTETAVRQFMVDPYLFLKAHSV